MILSKGVYPLGAPLRQGMTVNKTQKYHPQQATKLIVLVWNHIAIYVSPSVCFTLGRYIII